MTATITISEILKGNLYIGQVSHTDTKIEFQIDDFYFYGDLEMSLEVDKADPSVGVMFDSVHATSQTFTLTEILDEDGDKVPFSQIDVDLVEGWFNLIQLDII